MDLLTEIQKFEKFKSNLVSNFVNDSINFRL